MRTTATRPALRARALASRARALAPRRCSRSRSRRARGLRLLSAPGTAADPASAVPASARAVRRRDGPPRRRAEDSRAGRRAARSPTRPTPTCACSRALQTPGSPPLDFEHDVAPWLGPHAGIFLTSLDAPRARCSSLLEQGLLGGTRPARVPVQRRRRPGRDRARHERRRQGALVPDAQAAARRRARRQLPRRRLRGDRRRRRLRRSSTASR